MDDELRVAVDERLAERLEQNTQRRDGRRRRLAELSERRRYGLQQRHAAKLARNQGSEDE
ncbi:hypothetical protein [Spirillospora sp. NBC_01491]|uniref:hypothetical protein n=1 Tax=Spirillospora sp. NBC_01491 TaxID=2976007 RepID=UPI002E348999|nr:hypothetical protein [Spirillospora sp. NBC_01491]